MAPPARSGKKSLREQGNIAFKNGEWEKAIKLYTEALDQDYIPHRVDKEHLAALYSNRAAAYVKRCEYNYAHLDVHCIFTLKPGWFRGHERQATLLEGLGEFKAAEKYYGRAAEAVKLDPKHQGLADQFLDKQATMARLTKEPTGKSVLDWEYDQTRIKLLAAGETLDSRPAARIAIMARDLMDRGWNRFYDADLEHDLDGGFAGLWDVIEGYFYSGNAIRNYTRRAPPIMLSLKSVKLMQIHYPKALGWDVMDLGDTDERTRQVVALARREGWKAFRGRERWILGFLKQAMITGIREVTRPERSLLWLESAITMAERLQAEFSELREGATGDDLKLHLYRARTIAMSARVFRMGGDAEYTRKVVEPLQALSEKLFDHAVANFASTPEHEDPLLDTIYRKQPLAFALWAQAWCLRIRAHWPENLRHEIRPVAWCNVEMLRTAASLARKAEELVSVDEEQAPRYLEFALRCDLLAGGLTLGQLAAKSAEIERRRTFNNGFWGPSDDGLDDVILNRSFSTRSTQVLLGADRGLFEVNGVKEPSWSPWIRDMHSEVVCAQPAVFYCSEGEAEKYDGPKTYTEANSDPKVSLFMMEDAPSCYRSVEVSPATFDP